MRSYESKQISAGAWAAIAFAITFLAFPLKYAAPAVIGMAFVDPLIGYLRYQKGRAYPMLPIIVYFIICLTSLSILISWSWQVLLTSAIVSVIAVASEGYRIKYIDDDFMMTVVPVIVIFCILSATL